MKRGMLALLAGALLTGVSLPAAGQESAPEVVIGGQVVMRIRTGAGGLTPEERANSVRQRLGPILTMTDLTMQDVAVRQRRRGQTAAIYVRNRLLITVDRNLAQANDTTPGALARTWAANLREVLPDVRVEVRTPDS